MTLDEMHDVELLHELRESWEQVKESETFVARIHFGEVLAECARRELDFMECLQ